MILIFLLFSQCYCVLSNTNTTSTVSEGIIISGGDDWDDWDSFGTSVEVFNPTTGQSCLLPSLPLGLSGHTMHKLTVCGGRYHVAGGTWDMSDTCITLSSGEWVTSHALISRRYASCSWSTSSGVILMGGDEYEGGVTTETVREGEYYSQPGFTMEVGGGLLDACAINDHSTDTVILIGGKDTKNSVTRYNSHGFVEDLPSLIEGRYGGHGCGAYLRQDGSQVLLVTAGSGYDGVLSSTELLTSTSSTWMLLPDNLPKHMFDVRIATITGVLYMTGGVDCGDSADDYEDCIETDEVYQWMGTTSTWVEVGKMKVARSFHAVATISMEEVIQYCD